MKVEIPDNTIPGVLIIQTKISDRHDFRRNFLQLSRKRPVTSKDIERMLEVRGTFLKKILNMAALHYLFAHLENNAALLYIGQGKTGYCYLDHPEDVEAYLKTLR